MQNQIARWMTLLALLVAVSISTATTFQSAASGPLEIRQEGAKEGG